jgi:hypothetical protein
LHSQLLKKTIAYFRTSETPEVIEDKLKAYPKILAMYARDLLSTRKGEDYALSIIKRNNLLEKNCFSGREKENIQAQLRKEEYAYYDNILVGRDSFISADDVLERAKEGLFLHLPTDFNLKMERDVHFITDMSTEAMKAWRADLLGSSMVNLVQGNLMVNRLESILNTRRRSRRLTKPGCRLSKLPHRKRSSCLIS